MTVSTPMPVEALKVSVTCIDGEVGASCCGRKRNLMKISWYCGNGSDCYYGQRPPWPHTDRFCGKQSAARATQLTNVQRGRESKMNNYEHFETEGRPIKAWVKGVPFEDEARQQFENVARMLFIHRHVAAMPDVHLGMGATIGSVIPAKGAIIPAAVGAERRKDHDVIDETPGAYKDIDDVMAAKSDLVEVVHTLKQIVCVKG